VNRLNSKSKSTFQVTYFCIVSSSLQKDMKTDSINISGQSCVTNFIGITEFAKQIQRQEKQRMKISI
jgi:hypothetical protein